LTSKWKGPYVITRKLDDITYLVKNSRKQPGKVYHIDRSYPRNSLWLLQSQTVTPNHSNTKITNNLISNIYIIFQPYSRATVIDSTILGAPALIKQSLFLPSGVTVWLCRSHREFLG
jgi:hypothetical protein